VFVRCTACSCQRTEVCGYRLRSMIRHGSAAPVSLSGSGADLSCLSSEIIVEYGGGCDDERAEVATSSTIVDSLNESTISGRHLTAYS
jgi:hypothetical protein